LIIVVLLKSDISGTNGSEQTTADGDTANNAQARVPGDGGRIGWQ
jgi:hypothetical protein